MRVLFVVPPLTGHVNPTISVARALEVRGHEVAWVGHPGTIARLLPTAARIFPLPEAAPAALVAEVTDRARAVRGAAALKFLWQDFLVPLARSMLPGIEAAIREFSPSVLAVDQQAVAGGLAARRHDLPWATLATTSAGIIDPLAALPQVQRWLRDLIAGLERDAGLAPIDGGELSPHLVLAFTTDALVGPALPAGHRFPAHYRLVGPSIADRPEPTPFPFEQLRRPCVLVSMGTVNAEASGRFYATAIAALADGPRINLPGAPAGEPAGPAQLVLAAPPELVPDAPPHVIVRRYVPQLALLPHLDAVVCHGGHNTVCEALAHGLPLVVAPIKDDQPIVADQVVAAGAGLRVKFGRVSPAELRAAVARVLAEPSFRDAAGRIRDSFAAAGGAAAAAAAIEELV